MKTYEVTPEESGQKLLLFLGQKLGSAYSGKRLKQALEAGFCRVNGRPEKFASRLLGTGDRIAIDIQEGVKKASEPEILFEDFYYLVLNKPIGMPSEKLADPHHALCHRLDKETSGAILLAKTDEALRRAETLFRQRMVVKEYVAIVDGEPAEEGLLDNFIGTITRFEGQTLYGVVEPHQGQRAITQWKCDEKRGDWSFVRCFPQTGRTHQLRVHMASMGHPILGDKQYGKVYRSSTIPPRLFLHARRLSFKHPFSGGGFDVEAPLPAAFVEWMEETL